MSFNSSLYRKIKIIGLICLFLAASISGVQGVRNALMVGGSQDFQWDETRLILTRQNPYEIALNNQVPETVQDVPFGPVQVPSVFILLSPYAIFTWGIAKYLWLISNIIFTFVLLHLSLKLFLPEKPFHSYFIITTLFISSTPWRNLVGNGQETLFSLCFFVIAVWFARQRRDCISGIFLALSFFKYTIIFPLLLLFIYKKQYRILFIAFLIHLVIHLLVSLWLGVNPLLLVKQSLAVASSLSDQGYLDFDAFFSRMGITSPTFPTFFAAIVTSITIWVCLEYKENDELLILNALSILSTVVIYHRPYDYVVLLFSLILLFHPLFQSSILKPLLAVCLALIWYVDRLVAAILSPSYKVAVVDVEILQSASYFAFAALLYITLAYSIAIIARNQPMVSSKEGV